jgi:hypothetical protein
LACRSLFPGSDWGCPLQITGLKTTWRKPNYVFGIDGLQALHLAMKCANAVLQSAKLKLEWLGQTADEPPQNVRKRPLERALAEGLP